MRPPIEWWTTASVLLVSAPSVVLVEVDDWLLVIGLDELQVPVVNGDFALVAALVYVEVLEVTIEAVV